MKTRRLWRHPLLLAFQMILIGIAGAWVGVAIWDGTKGDLELVTVHAAFEPTLRGGTRVDLPPFGSLSARTHKGLLRLHVQVARLHVDETMEWVKQHKTPEDAAAYLKTEIQNLSARLVKGTLLAALIGAFLASFMRRTNWRYTLVGTAAGSLGVAVPLAMILSSYNIAAFSSPRFEGELSRARFLLNAVHQGYNNAVEQIPVITSQVVELYRQVETNGAASTPDSDANLRVLLISDLHNNPLGLRFALDLAKSYEVGLVLVCGDMTDFGHPLEGDLLTGWDSFKVPVVMVTGNHDSRSVVRSLSDIPEVTFLDNGDSVKMKGLTIMGFGDPAAERESVGNVNPTAKDLEDLTSRITVALSDTDAPDVLMVHNFRVARNVAGHTPLIATGHSHAPLVEERKGTVIVNPGTTGATGLRYFTSRKDVPYGAAVLRFTTDGDRPKLSVVDLVEMQQLSGDFVVRRKNISQPDEPRRE